MKLFSWWTAVAQALCDRKMFFPEEELLERTLVVLKPEYSQDEYAYGTNQIK